MKKNILFSLLLFSQFFYKANAQTQLNYYPYSSPIAMGAPQKILDFEGKKLILANYEILLLDTANGKLVPLSYPASLNLNYPNDAAIDSTGKLLLLFDNAIYEFNGSKWKAHFIDSANTLFNLIVDSSNLVHCYSYNNIDYQWNGINWKTVTVNNLYIGESIINYLIGPDGDYRLQTSKNRIFGYSNGGYELKDSIKSVEPVLNPQYDKYRDIWYSLNDTLIKRDSMGNTTILNSNNSPVKSNYSQFLLRLDGVLFYMGLNSDTLFIYKNSTWSLFAILNINNSTILYLNNNELWAYNYPLLNDNSNLYVFKNILIKDYSGLFYTLNNFRPNCVLNSPLSDDVFIGSDEGLYDLRDLYNSYPLPFKGKMYDTSNTSLTTNHIYSIEDNAGTNYFNFNDTLYIGTNMGLFVVVNIDSFSILHHYTTINSPLPSDSVYALRYFKDFNSGNTLLWIGTYKGCASLNLENGIWTIYDTANSVLPSDKINSITWQPNSSVYICTDSGFVQVKDTVLKAFTTHNSGIPNPNVTGVAEESLAKGTRLWVGTMGGGLASYIDTSGHWDYFSKSKGNFPSDSLNFLYSYNYQLGFPASVIGTKDTGAIIFADNSPYFSSPYEVQTFEKNIFAYYQNVVECEGLGWEFAGIGDSGLIFNIACFGGIDEKKPATKNLSAWIEESQLNILWSQLTDGKANVCLYDMMGRNVMNVTGMADGSKHISTPLPALASGIYVLRVIQRGNAGSQLLQVMK